MAVHLILLGINELDPTLAGKVKVYSDCKGALDKVEGAKHRRNSCVNGVY